MTSNTSASAALLRPAGHLLAETLAAAGVTRVWCVPGESYLGLLDGLYGHPDIQVVTARHEGGAGFMALAEARLTGRPAICMVSRGPGLSNAMIAAHVAQQDGVPLLLLVGQVPRNMRGRGAFQEVDYARTFSDIAKAVFEINDPGRIGEFAAQAWHVASAGRPGPVVLSLPEDMLLDLVDSQPARLVDAARPQPDQGSLAAIAGRLASAQRPLLIAGEALATGAGRAALLAFAEARGVPVLCSHKHQDLFPNRHPLWAGHIGHVIPGDQAKLWAEADLIIAAGSILGDIDSQGYGFPSFPIPSQPLVQIHHDPVALGRHYRPALTVCADAAATLAALAGDPGAGHSGWSDALHALAQQSTAPAPGTADALYVSVLSQLDRQAGADAIFTMDSGRFASMAHRHIAYGGGRRLIGTASGAMGNGVPAAVAAAVLYPGREVIAIVGDGGLLMTGNELATAMQEQVPIRILVVNNARFGAIERHQQRLFPGRTHAMELANPDLLTWAASFGALGLKLTGATDLEATIARFLTHPGSTLLEVASE